MWGFIKGMFGGSSNNSDIANKAADGIYNGLDKLIHTDEEKADALAEGRKVFLKFIDKAYDQNSIRSVTRRWLAFMVVGPTMGIVVLMVLVKGLAVYMASKPGGEYAKFLFETVQLLAPWAGGVLIFYFGPHLIGALRTKKE